MNTKEGLFDILESWRRLTVCECAAILESHWQKVAEYQGEKQLLQPEIDRLLNGSTIQQFIDSTIQRAVSELISLERANAALIAEKRSVAEKQRGELERASRNLRQVHRAYGSEQNPVWNSYS
jgi:hypothetical protein